ncbi:MAG: hypothetical protein HYY60_02315 [Parcubacteria group bacterium]|nr:hypothetical protein [Parcubacteria group bacterium]
MNSPKRGRIAAKSSDYAPTIVSVSQRGRLLPRGGAGAPRFARYYRIYCKRKD